jgi:hypothetical protein
MDRSNMSRAATRRLAGARFLATGICASGNSGPPLRFDLATGNCASGNSGPPLLFDLATGNCASGNSDPPLL